jgi:hypothetical protein
VSFAVNDKKQSRHPLATLLVNMLMGAAIGYLGMAFGMTYLRRWFGPLNFDAMDWTLLILGAPVAFFFAIVVHELGHLAGALACGFRFRVLTLGPWSIIRSGDKWQHRFSRSVMGIISGQQISSPPPAGASDRQFLVYLLGGGVANLLMVAVIYVLLPGAGLPVLAAMLLTIFAALNLLLGLVNLLPISTAAGVRTDGFQIRTLLRGDDEAIRFRALFAVVADIYAGVRPREWSRDRIEQLQLGRQNVLEQAIAFTVKLQAAMDRGETEAAGEAVAVIEALYEQLPAALRSQFATELAFYYSMVRGDAAKARRYADDVAETAYLISPATVHRARAAALFAEGRDVEALAEIDTGLACADKATNELDRVMEPEWLEALRARLAARHHPAVALATRIE